MKLTASCTPFEALPPDVWRAFRTMVQTAASTWGLSVAIDEGPSITEAIANFWSAQRINENARLAATVVHFQGADLSRRTACGLCLPCDVDLVTMEYETVNCQECRSAIDAPRQDG